LRFLSDISATLARIHTKYYLCRDNISQRAPSPCGANRPLGGGGRGSKNSKKLGVVSFVHRTPTISIFLSDAKCSPICTAQTCAHSSVETSTSAKAFLQGGPKSSKKFPIFHHFETLRPYISETIKTEAYKQCMQKRFIPPLSNCRICMNQSLTGFYRVGQKLSDVIPVLRITPTTTEPSTVSVFLSSVKCGRICRALTCAHSGIEPSTLAKGFQRMVQKFEKNFEFLTISSLHVPYISVTAKNTGLQAAYSFLIGTREASRFYSNSNRTSRSIRFESDGPIRKFLITAPATFAVVP